MLTTQDFIFIGKILKKHKLENNFELIDDLVWYFKDANERFNEEKFRAFMKEDTHVD